MFSAEGGQNWIAHAGGGGGGGGGGAVVAGI